MHRTNIKRIEKDYARFRNIVRGLIKKDFRKYITQGEMIGKRGKNIVSIPFPQLRIPTFRHGEKSGVGQGEGEIGGAAGDQPGNHLLEVDITIEELAQIMKEELALPRIKPKGKNIISAPNERYKGIARAGPESLRHFKRTYKEALKRTIAEGTYDPASPIIIPIREDKRYRTRKPKEVTQNNAVIIYMMDVSGSMGGEQKEIVRIEAFWIDTWLKSQYKKLETRYIAHDIAAQEVDRETFYNIKESGGTKISSAYQLCSDIIKNDYDLNEWNVYPFHFSDGDNWGGEDTQKCIDILNDLFPRINVFCYGQVSSTYGSGEFKKSLDGTFKNDERLITNEIRNKDGIYDSIKGFLGKGK